MKKSRIALTSLLALSLTLSFVACGGEDDRLGGGDLADLFAFIYIANFGSDNVSAYSVDEDGEVATIDGQPFGSDAGPIAIALSPDNQYLAVANYEDGTMIIFEIDPETGELTEVGEPVFVGDDEGTPTAIIFHPDGEFIYVATENGDFYGYHFDPATGDVEEAYDQNFGPFVTAMAFDGNFLFLTTEDGALFVVETDPDHEMDGNGNDFEFVDVINVDEVIPDPCSQGIAADVPGSNTIIQFDPWVANLAIGPGGDRIYLSVVAPENCVVNAPPQLSTPFHEHTGPGFIVTVGFDGEGLFLPESENTVISIGDTPDGIVVTPDGDFLYVAEGGDDLETPGPGTIRAFAIDDEGELDEFDTFTAGEGAQAMAIDGSGSVIAVANALDGTVSAFFVEDDGSLTEVDGSPFDVGELPLALASTQ